MFSEDLRGVRVPERRPVRLPQLPSTTNTPLQPQYFTAEFETTCCGKGGRESVLIVADMFLVWATPLRCSFRQATKDTTSDTTARQLQMPTEITQYASKLSARSTGRAA